MHSEAKGFVERCLQSLPARRSVVEFGGKNINGTVRDLFLGLPYISIDIEQASGVDVVADAATYVPPFPPHTVVCCEVLEHSPYPDKIINNAYSILSEDGALILTTATDPRLPHSGVTGNLELETGEHYANISYNELRVWLEDAGFRSHSIDVSHEGDIWAMAVK